MLLDAIFSVKCIFCGVTLPVGAPVGICQECALEIPFYQGDYLFECGRGQRTSSEDYCDRVVCALKYEGIVRGAISRFKFYSHREYGSTLAALIIDKLLRSEGNEPQFDVVTCVPLSRARAKERGYNQASVLARHIAGFLGAPFRGDLLTRDEAALRQSSLKRGERAANVSKAFHVPDGVYHELFGVRILLVDDIATSLATINVCATELKRAGAGSVVGCVAASPSGD